MTGKSKLKSTLLCIVFMTICMIGCGTPVENVGTEEETVVDETAAGQTSEDDVSVDEEQAAAEITEEEHTLEGLSLSIFGDSISTYDGYIPEGFAVFYPFSGEVTDVSQTWWMKLLDDTGMELCANGSSSGSTCVGESLSTDNPKFACSDYRISMLTGKQGKMPDVIIVYMGTNDLLKGIELGDNDGTKMVEEGGVENFSDAYTLMLDKLASTYPAAQIYCCTLPPVGDFGTEGPYTACTNRIGLTGEDYSKQIQTIAENKGIPVIDLYHCGIEFDNMTEMTTDGVHFTPAGMEYVERAMLDGIK